MAFLVALPFLLPWFLFCRWIQKKTASRVIIRIFLLCVLHLSGRRERKTSGADCIVCFDWVSSYSYVFIALEYLVPRIPIICLVLISSTQLAKIFYGCFVL